MFSFYFYFLSHIIHGHAFLQKIAFPLLDITILTLSICKIIARFAQALLSSTSTQWVLFSVKISRKVKGEVGNFVMLSTCYTFCFSLKNGQANNSKKNQIENYKIVTLNSY